MSRFLARVPFYGLSNGIDTARFAPDVTPLARADFGIADDAIVFGAAMRLTEQKNPLGLIAAFASGRIHS